MEKIQVSNHVISHALNHDSKFCILWPTDFLGEYASRYFDGYPVTPEAADAALDRYVRENVDLVHPALRIVGVCAGRTTHGECVIVVSIQAIDESGAIMPVTERK